MGVKKNSLSCLILLTLEKTVDGLVELNDFVNNMKNYSIFTGRDYPLRKSALSQAIKRLRERKLIEADSNDTNKIMLRLTDLGKEAMGFEREDEWDGKWRVVIFDIPEQKRVIRNLFRRRLKKWGFQRWQQSVWVTKRNVAKKLRILIQDLKIEDWIAVIESEDVLIGNKLLDGRSK